MIREPAGMGNICCALGVLSASIIAFELLLMQILSIVQWYHFASMIISVALLGFGVSGTILAFTSRWLVDRFDIVLPVLLIATGLAMPVALWCSQLPSLRFDSYLLFAQQSHIWRLFITYAIFFVPFVLGALAIGLAFVGLSRHIGMLYCANLIGSGVGGIILILALWLFLPERLAAVISFACIISGILTVPRRFPPAILAAAISCIIPLYFFLNPPGLHPSEFKDIRRALDLPGASVQLAGNSPYGLVQIVSSPVLRYAPGISLAYKGKIPATEAVFVNGDWYGPVGDRENTQVLLYTTGAVAYEMQARENVLILDAATGAGMFPALYMGARRVTVVEPNAPVMKVLKTSADTFVKSPGNRLSVSPVNMNSRTYLDIDAAHYDLIVLPDVGSFGGSSGLYALKEQYLLTREAFGRIWEKLRPQGVMSITCWMDYPGRSPLRILATMVEMLSNKGVDNPGDYIVAVRGWATMTFVLKRSAISGDEQRRIRDFCSRMLFDPALLPDISARERARYNHLADDALFVLLDEIITGGSERVYKEYEFAVSPATDNRPYFSRFLKAKSIAKLSRLFGKARLPFFELGYVLVILTLVQVSCAAFVLIVAPFFTMGWKTPGRTGVLVYFSGIALGYMFVEIVLIQRLILYFSSPVYSAAAVISVMLIFSGIGSYLSTALNIAERYLPVLIGAIICFILIAPVGLPFVVQATIAMPRAFKLLTILFCVALPSVVMGMPFPVGIMVLRRRDARALPWAWGINGCFSVISTVLATIIAVETGFSGVMICAAGAYGLALAAYLFRLGSRSGSR